MEIRDSKKYNNLKLAIGIIKGIISFILILLFVALGYSSMLVNYLSGYFSNPYLLFIAFVFVTGIATAILFAPVNYYTDFYLEHKYNLSNQTFLKYIIEHLKGLIVSVIIGVPVLLFFFYVLNEFGSLWWLPLAIGLFVISVLLGRIAPVLILPIFYKISPIDNEDLKSRIERLAEDAGIKVQNVYKFNMSKNTKKANAAFTGLGKSKRILLGDTLLENYTQDEIETVIAHEMGHYKKKHIIKNIVIGTLSSFLTLFLIALLYENTIPLFGFDSITQIAALPILSLWGAVIGLIQSPFSNILSRKFEYEADEYAVTATSKVGPYISTLEKLTEQNLGDKDPHPFVEWFFYSHPSIKNRISALKKFVKDLSFNRELKFEENS
ncbi:MAG TPA: M48 family metallopeptidase [Ignavibacteriaceae bacterium]|nr:M48 family metallopeptidase [Ignavibacteriaceae bacterium]